MKKAVIVLSGSPEAKNKFAEIVKKISWRWEINPKDFVRESFKLFYWDGSKTDETNKLAAEQLELYNNKFDFERKYLTYKITKFNEDDSEVKVSGDKTFDKFVLIAHGVSKNLVSFLQEEFGAFKIHLTKKEYNSNQVINDAVILYEDDENFVVEVNRLIDILTR